MCVELVSVQVDLKSMDRGNGVIAHFLACHGHDRRLAALSFDPRYSTPAVLLYYTCCLLNIYLYCLAPY